MATITYESPDGVAEESVDADKITDSGRVQGIRVKLEDESYVHIPDTRLYCIRMTEDEAKADYSPA